MERYTCSWIKRLNVVKVSTLSKAIHRFNTITIKIPTAFFTEVAKNNVKFRIEPQKTLNSQSNPEKEKAEGITPPDFKLYYKAVVIKIVWH